MYKKDIYPALVSETGKAVLQKKNTIKWLSVAVLLFMFACKNEDTKAPDIMKDSVAAGGSGTGGNAKSADTTQVVMPAKSVAVTGKDSAKYATPTIKTVEDETKAVITPVSGKTIPTHKDSVKAAAKAPVPATVDPAAVAKTTVPDNTKTDAPDHVFVPKYGVIPRNTTESNIAAFVKAFPDKTTAIRINFDGDADAEMQAVKAQIVKVLRSSGYVNVSDQSISLNPIRMPKEIHYELQRDESVVIWVQPANTQ